VNCDIGEVLNAEFWFAKAAVGWCGECSGLGMLVGTLFNELEKGGDMAVPNREKDEGVRGSRRRALKT
jgi:hypothetical protein